MDQINSKNYALPYETEGRQIVKVGVAFERETMTVGDYKVELGIHVSQAHLAPLALAGRQVSRNQ